MFNVKLDEIRSEAKAAAARFLENEGFVADGNVWGRPLTLANQANVPIRLQLPPRFPDDLPVITIDRAILPHRIPHVEKTGKLCLAPATGVLLDATNPEGIIRDSVERARTLLHDGITRANAGDLEKEFLAYWKGEEKETLLADCQVCGPARELALVRIRSWHKSGLKARDVIVDNESAGLSLIDLLGGVVQSRKSVFFLPIDTSFVPPDFDDIPTTSQILDILRKRSSKATWSTFERWLGRSVLPVTMVVSMPASEAPCLFAIRIGEAQANRKDRNVPGFRAGNAPASMELAYTKRHSIGKLNVERFDLPFLLRRGGAMESLSTRTVAVIGCGSVGSHAVERLASLGISRFRLIDAEALASQNLYRHALGAEYLEVNKAVGLGEVLRKKYLHIDVQSRPHDIGKVLTQEQDFVLSADLILVALGDETVELRLNELLGARLPRVHAWLDPLGLGGHILATGLPKQRGCFRCLFDLHEVHGLQNGASFARAGQQFQKSFAGCSGSFTPFSAIDADRTALEAARLATRILEGKEERNVLVSWFGDTEDFEKARFELSKRAQLFNIGDRRYSLDFTVRDCPHCKEWCS